MKTIFEHTNSLDQEKVVDKQRKLDLEMEIEEVYTDEFINELVEVEVVMDMVSIMKELCNSTGHSGRNGIYSTYSLNDFDLKYCLRELYKVVGNGRIHIEKLAVRGDAYESDLKAIATMFFRNSTLEFPFN